MTGSDLGSESIDPVSADRLQPTPQPMPGRGEPALDRSDRTTQEPRRLFVGSALQVAEHDRPKPLGKPAELRMQERPEIFPAL